MPNPELRHTDADESPHMMSDDADEMRPLMPDDADLQPRWYVMRDLKRPNSLSPAYRMLAEAGFETFTPMRTVVLERGGRSMRKETPVIPDLLFVHSQRKPLEKIVRKTPTLQFRFVKGAPFGTAMEVRGDEMERFINFSRLNCKIRYFSPEEITPEMVGREVTIIGGMLDGQKCNLMSVRGSRKRRILVSLPGIVSASIEVEPQYISLSESN